MIAPNARTTRHSGSVRHHGYEAAELLDFHLSMLLDEARMAAYQRAIDQVVKPGDVVLDIGAGTGVLSFLASKAGARRVYAIEAGPVIDVARELSEANGFSGRVAFVDGWSTDVELPEPADVLVTETIGNAGFDEGIIAWTHDARCRLIRPGGLVLPRKVRMWTAAVESWDDHAQVIDWSAPSLPFDYTVVRRRAEQEPWFAHLRAQQSLTEPAMVAEVDLRTTSASDIRASGVLQVGRSGTLHGLACWFDAELADDVTLTNAPPSPAPSWGQRFLPVGEPAAVRTGDCVEWEIQVSADGEQLDWHVETRLLSTEN